MQYAISLENDEVSEMTGVSRTRGDRTAQIINREAAKGSTFQKVVSITDVNGQTGDVVLIFTKEDK